MAESFQPVPHSPLSGMAAPRGGVAMAERPYVGKLNLRGDPGDPSFLQAVERTLGLALPLAPNTFTSSGELSVFWLGPNEWLVHCLREDVAGLTARLRESLAGIHCAATDVSDYYLVIRLSGQRAREVISKGTPLDVHPRHFGPGQCAQTRFGHASILISCVDDGPVLEIQFRWSFAEYVWTFLAESAREYEDSGAGPETR